MLTNSQLCGCFSLCCRLFWSILVLFFFRFWLILGTTSCWVGSEFSCLWCCLPLVDLPSIVSARLGFQDLVFGDLTSMLFFISRGWLHGLMILFRLLFYLCSLILLHLSLLLASLVALFSPYLLLQVWIVFSSVYALCAWKVISSLKFELLFFGGRLPFSSLRLFLFFSCFPWCRCAELVFGALVSST